MKLTVNKLVASLTTAFFAIACFVTTKAYAVATFAATDEMDDFARAWEEAMEEQRSGTNWTLNIVLGVIILGGIAFLIRYLVLQGNQGRAEIQQQEAMRQQQEQQYAYDMAVYEQQKREWDEYQARKKAEEEAAATGQPAPQATTPPAPEAAPSATTPPPASNAPDLSANQDQPPTNPPADSGSDDSAWRPQEL